MPKPHKYRELARILKAYDSDFEFFKNRAKGSERMIYHPNINGKPESFPIKYHGKNTEVYKGVISDLIKRFDLPGDLL